VRTYAALKYLSENSNQDEITQYIISSGGIPTRHLSTALVAARAGFRAGADDVLTDTCDKLDPRFPESPDLAAGHANFHAYHGRYDEAFAFARKGRILQPSHAGSVARMVTYGYRILPHDEADKLAVTAAERFPRNSEVQWACAKLCDSSEQFHRLRKGWE